MLWKLFIFLIWFIIFFLLLWLFGFLYSKMKTLLWNMSIDHLSKMSIQEVYYETTRHWSKYFKHYYCWVSLSKILDLLTLFICFTFPLSLLAIQDLATVILSQESLQPIFSASWSTKMLHAVVFLFHFPLF